MLKIILLLVLLLLVVAALLIVGFISYVKSQNRKKSAIPALGPDPVTSSKTDTCSRCGERRIIVNEDDKLCASCYSALRTKKLG
jgi:hypothetical protein